MEFVKRTNIPKPTVYRVLFLIKKKTLNHKKGAGRPNRIYPNGKRRIAALIKRNPQA